MSAVEIPDPTVAVTRYAVTCLPAGHRMTRHFTIQVEARGGGLWAVLHQGMEAGPSGAWRPRGLGGRFKVTTALELAKRLAPDLTVNGHTVADALAGR